jgi:spore germination cell wall hydrolase CwlJ-like protein
MSQYQLFTPSRIAAWLGLALKAVLLVAAIVVIFHVLQSRYDQLRVAGQQPVPQLVSAQDRMQQLDCLTRNIYWEAASEPFEGKVAVAQVTMNRLESGRFANSVCGVVYQKNIVYERVICQFSWYCQGNNRVKPVHAALWRESEEVAKRVLFENLRLPSMKNALYYHAVYISPQWSKPRIAQIGQHIFYGERV